MMQERGDGLTTSTKNAYAGLELSPYANLSPQELLRLEIKTERVEQIALNQIVVDAGITDDQHVTALAESMSGPRGQLSSLIVRARTVDQDSINYDVIDGFHRAKALLQLGKSTCVGKVVYGCSDEELFDLRVLAANSVRSVSFSRIATWMQSSFRQTPWYVRGLSLVQICTLQMTGGKGSRLGLTPEEAKQAQEWIEEKVRRWSRPVSAIFNIARAYEAADPNLIYQVRVGGGGSHGKHGELSPARFSAIVVPLAGEFDLQRRLVEVVLKHNFVAKDAEILAKAVAFVKEIPRLVDEIIANPDIALETLRNDHAEPSKSQINEYQTLQVGRKSLTTIYRRERRSKNGSPPPKPVTVESANQDRRLDTRIEELERQLETAVLWWRNSEKISETEREIMVRFIEKTENLEEISTAMSLTPFQILQFIQLAYRKYFIELRGKNIL
ncbi:MAG: hypothetical protein UV61_C0027G0003 [Candidatus Gottesmanbacteria bacterium GW2011_GWB1_43_11]|uniref:Uncharacterized protein n=1 Tax=Candidatus Gottesmanbacteria bacterium GW2011_GWB1_43_11 TaxID=1618446 RepID=A0A0G1ENM1_9BACT|nr:MAG: hypothetical protein UV04_C0023G0007 [Candidatus Gottesmanbacteria bacterium GW2011_GWA2_42_16]KKS51721.1 MAG: hypothetical protein UV17_C0058G0009 [Candidatus Gottesmanbacteria bacterium GW2011_GWA1_42_26]KKS80788.1 MAG: hypothetical protein UV55_C0030G0008 [Candidatus Gottesmanbacteria bacterium GW2011_GWC1_43_10]KKS84606.1 MAG: hypothetical protein UV61_C0027G0003 [Candidatus Gottesmanbacteria bacterium GW2011_GWB1_43_11]OGG07599.1 MAG: hypothetical protein A2699_02065 [Candidatus Go